MREFLNSPSLQDTTSVAVAVFNDKSHVALKIPIEPIIHDSKHPQPRLWTIQAALGQMVTDEILASNGAKFQWPSQAPRRPRIEKPDAPRLELHVVRFRGDTFTQDVESGLITPPTIVWRDPETLSGSTEDHVLARLGGEILSVVGNNPTISIFESDFSLGALHKKRALQEVA